MQPHLAARLRLICVAIFLALPACRSAEAEFVPAPGWLNEHSGPPERPPFYEAGLNALDSASSADFELGDRMLFELVFERGEESTLRYLELEVMRPAVRDGRPLLYTITSTINGEQRKSSFPGYDVQLRLFGGKGELIQASSVVLGTGVVGNHVAPCEALEVLRQRMSPEEMESIEWDGVEDPVLLAYANSFGSSIESLVSLFGLAQGDDLLANLMWDVIDKPSLLSLAWRGGISLEMDPRYKDSQRFGGGAGAYASPGLAVAGPLRTLPLGLEINDKPALYLDLVIVPPVRPWHLTGGIVALEGRHPRKDVTVRARAVALTVEN